MTAILIETVTTMINNVVLAGTLANKPLLRHIKNTDKAVLLFTIVVERENTKAKDYVKCIFRNDDAERFISHSEKGQKIVVQGCLQNNNFTTNSGKKVKDYEIAVRHADLIRSGLNYAGLLIPKENIDPNNEHMDYFYESD